ncbi:hypothetical protein HY346_03045 [Candidatus Microgenomates bacterium]|nr:hypothetical protein [Candidatus Microgenomates bacterium]
MPPTQNPQAYPPANASPPTGNQPAVAPLPGSLGGIAPAQPTTINPQPSPPPLTTNGPVPGSQAAAPIAAGAPLEEIAKPRKTKKGKTVSTQDALLITQVRDGLVVMRDGSLRAVVMCKSINFDLMSPAERESVEFAYQGFLNSLYFPVQIFIRSQRVDLNTYLDKLGKIHDNQENVLLRLLMEDYVVYVRYLAEAANIMDKQFYVVIQYYPSVLSAEGVTSGLRRLGSIFKSKPGPITINETDYNKYKTELAQRVQTVVSGLAQINIQAIPLNTQELIELYYTAYNPQTAAHQHLVNQEELEAAIVTKAETTEPIGGNDGPV